MDNVTDIHDIAGKVEIEQSPMADIVSELDTNEAEKLSNIIASHMDTTTTNLGILSQVRTNKIHI